jgi:hypothetical protein
MTATPPETIPAPQPGATPPSPQIAPEKRAKASRKVLIALLLATVILGAIVFAFVYTHTNLLSGYNTYSNYGVSFQYPKSWTISEHGASTYSGIIIAQSKTSNSDLLLVAWSYSADSIDPATVLSPAIYGFQRGSGGTNLVMGQQCTTTTSSGYSVAYQPFSITVSGSNVNAVWSAWYSTHGQRLYQMSVFTSGQDAINPFNSYLSNFTEQ